MISRTTRSFWKHYDALPQDVQRQAVRAYLLWRSDPGHPSLQFKCVSQKHAAFSVRVGFIGALSDIAMMAPARWS